MERTERKQNITLAQEFYKYSTEQKYSDGNVIVGKVRNNASNNSVYLTVKCGCIWAYTTTTLYPENAEFFAVHEFFDILNISNISHY